MAKSPGNILSRRVDVRALRFTESGIAGRLIQSAAAISNMENIILELGRKSPAIIFSDADVAKAVEETKYSIQWDSGQVCMANSKIYAYESIASTFIELFIKRFAAVAIDDPLLPDEPRTTGRGSNVQAGSGLY